MALIGLHGRARAGKDTIAERLVHRHEFARLALADPLKDGLVAMLGPLGVTRARLEQDKHALLPGLLVSPRRLMQTLGTEWGRSLIRHDLWIQIAQNGIEQRRRFCKHIVVTDVRFEDEATWLRAQGGAIWHVRRPTADNVRDLHVSEAGIAIAPGIDTVIDNDRGIDQLWDRVRDALAGECVA